MSILRSLMRTKLRKGGDGRAIKGATMSTWLANRWSGPGLKV